MTTWDHEHEARFEQLGRFFMGTSDVHVALARVTRKLEELAIPYAVCGALAVNAYNVQRATTDVDLLLSADGLAKFKAHALGRGWLEKFPGSRGVRDMDRRVPIDFLLTGGIPGDGTPHGVVFPDPAEVAVEVNGRKFLSLSKLVELKLASGLSAPDRLKDLADVIALIRANQLGEHFAEPLRAAEVPRALGIRPESARPAGVRAPNEDGREKRRTGLVPRPPAETSLSALKCAGRSGRGDRRGGAAAIELLRERLNVDLEAQERFAPQLRLQRRQQVAGVRPGLRDRKLEFDQPHDRTADVEPSGRGHQRPRLRQVAARERDARRDGVRRSRSQRNRR